MTYLLSIYHDNLNQADLKYMVNLEFVRDFGTSEIQVQYSIIQNSMSPKPTNLSYNPILSVSCQKSEKAFFFL